nr:hypothetical protein [Actinomycetota bacterium]
MPALSELLKGSVSEKLKQLIAPSGLIPAALFVLLTFAFIFPEAKEQAFTPAVEFYDLKSDGWQVAAITFLILVVGYVLGSASGGVLDTLSGRTWSLSITHLVLSGMRNWRRERAKAVVAAGKTKSAKDRPLERLSQAEWRRESRFAPDDRPSAPTSLGDVLRAAEGGTKQRYAISLAGVWEPLRAALPEEDAAVKLVGAEKDSVDLMAGLWLALTAFFVEATICFSIWGEPDKVLLSLLALPAAFIAYRVTVAKTVSWTDAMTNAIAIHHEDVRKKLLLREASDTADRRALWTAASDFLLLGRGDPGGLFDPVAPPPPADSVRSSGTIKVESTPEAYSAREGFATQHEAGVRYSVMVSPRTEETDATVSGQVLIANPSIVRIAAAPTLDVAPAGNVVARVLRAPAPELVDTLLLEVTDLASTAAVSAGFTLPRWRLAVTQGLEARVEETEAGSLKVTVSNGTEADISGARLELFHVLDGRRTVEVYGVEG